MVPDQKPTSVVHHYSPGLEYPLFARVTFPLTKSADVGETVEVHNPQANRPPAHDDGHKFEHEFDALVVGVQEYTFEELHPLLIAFLGGNKSRSKALAEFMPGKPPYDDDKEILVEFLLKTEKTKDLIESHMEVETYASQDTSE